MDKTVKASPFLKTAINELDTEIARLEQELAECKTLRDALQKGPPK